MLFNDGSQFRVVTDPGLHLRKRDLFEFRACSARTTNGTFKVYVDSTFTQHRQTLAGMRALLMYQFVYSDFTPEYQADFFCETIGSIRDNEMVMLDLEQSSGITLANSVDFTQRWLARVDSTLQTLPWVYLPQFYSGQVTRKVTQNRIVKAPRYGTDNGLAQTSPNWGYDVWQFTTKGDFPGCTQTGDLNYTAWTPEQLLSRCSGVASPIVTARSPRQSVPMLREV